MSTTLDHNRVQRTLLLPFVNLPFHGSIEVCAREGFDDSATIVRAQPIWMVTKENDWRKSKYQWCWYCLAWPDISEVGITLSFVDVFFVQPFSVWEIISMSSAERQWFEHHVGVCNEERISIEEAFISYIPILNCWLFQSEHIPCTMTHLLSCLFCMYFGWCVHNIMKIQQIYLVFIMRRLESSWMRQILQSYSECTLIHHYWIETDAMKSFLYLINSYIRGWRKYPIHCWASIDLSCASGIVVIVLLVHLHLWRFISVSFCCFLEQNRMDCYRLHIS